MKTNTTRKPKFHLGQKVWFINPNARGVCYGAITQVNLYPFTFGGEKTAWYAYHVGAEQKSIREEVIFSKQASALHDLEKA